MDQSVWIRALLVMVILPNIPALAAKKVTVAQLEEIVAQAHGKPDKDAARQIEMLTLTERISRPELDKLEAELQGPKSRETLLVLADASAFLDLPAGEIPTIAAPSMTDQREIVLRAVQFSADMAHKMPDFFATRDITQYQSTEAAKVLDKAMQDGQRLQREKTVPFQEIGKSRVNVLYRNGREAIENEPTNKVSRNFSVENKGEFGEFLEIVIADMVGSEIKWSHWEKDGANLLAVFRFEVPRDRARYQWTFCCARSKDGKEHQLKSHAGYQAEMAIDPTSGSVLRLAVQTQPSDPPVLDASEIVEYGPVEIGGRTYICPLRNIVLYAAWTDERGTVAAESARHLGLQPPISTDINHTVFEDYHVFRSEMRIIPGEPREVPPAKPEPDAKSDSHTPQ